MHKDPKVYKIYIHKCGSFSILVATPLSKNWPFHSICANKIVGKIEACICDAYTFIRVLKSSNDCLLSSAVLSVSPMSVWSWASEAASCLIH